MSMSGSQVRGRRPAGSGTRLAIEEAARRRFAEVAYPRTTMRAIAADAGVGPRLIAHFFGSKQKLALISRICAPPCSPRRSWA
jgi:AcrR family transcriptional regulator